VGEALSRARALGVDLPERAPEEAAEILLALARDHDLTVFEFFETDEAGHARSMERAREALTRLDRLLRALVARLPRADSLVVASDHGNVEDLSTRNHTRARVPVLLFGRAADEADTVGDLTHLAPLLLRLAGRGGLRPPAGPG
jgi:phosphopentomutase